MGSNAADCQHLAPADDDVSSVPGASMDIASASVEIAKAKRGWRLPERLPDLKGKWLTASTILWARMLPLAMTGAALSAWINLTTPAMWTPYGFATSEDSTGIHVDAVTAPT